MTAHPTPPIACTLAPGEFQERLAEIATLARDALRYHNRRDLVLELEYAPEAAKRVRELLRREQACCGFLVFNVRVQADGVRVTIRAPEEARDAVDLLFGQLVGPAGAAPDWPCCRWWSDRTDREDNHPVRLRSPGRDRGLFLLLGVAAARQVDAVAGTRNGGPCAVRVLADARRDQRGRAGVCRVWRRLHRRITPLAADR